ncbi:AMP-binding protein [Bordetella tumulicola]|uniref:ANL family adenylate-forming protein n=1 Tax=Bordetella tumulicola TaxID=1649133 RepID=UPI0039EE839B
MEWMTERLHQFDGRAIAEGDAATLTYAGFVERIAHWRDVLDQWRIAPGERIGLVADYHIEVVALIVALIGNGCVVVPLPDDEASVLDERLDIVCATRLIRVVGGATQATCHDLAFSGEVSPLLNQLVAHHKPGFVIFTSGSTGKSKAVLLDFERMVEKFRSKARNGFRTLLFLKLDHIGGLNTLFSVILNGGTVVTCGGRQAAEICACVETNAVELLPTTPSFLTMLLMSGVYRDYDLSSLKVITYGTEAMPESTLVGLHRAFPGVVLKQTYGLSELGILATQSKDSSSRWMKIGGAGYEVKVQNGTLWIKSASAMLGYLNAPSPFDADGWYDTGDKVAVDGEYVQILGRESEIINVGGEKVFPIEVESFLLTLDNVRDVIVRNKPSPVLGQIVWAEFVLAQPEDAAAFRKRVVDACRGRLAPFKIPGLITLARADTLVGDRFKKIRKSKAATPAVP